VGALSTVKGRFACYGAAALVALLAATGSAHVRPASMDWRQPRFLLTTTGLGVSYPRTWSALEVDGALVVASFPLSRDWTTQEHKRVPDRAVYIQVFTYGWLPQSYGFPQRPSHFELLARDHGFYACGFGLEGYALRFRQKGLALQAMVALGRGARAQDATAVLDGLTVRGIPPRLARS
jgi:hypothetical protein